MLMHHTSPKPDQTCGQRRESGRRASITAVHASIRSSRKLFGPSHLHAAQPARLLLSASARKSMLMTDLWLRLTERAPDAPDEQWVRQFQMPVLRPAAFRSGPASDNLHTRCPCFFQGRSWCSNDSSRFHRHGMLHAIWPEECPGEVSWPDADANGPETAANMKQSPAQIDRKAIASGCLHCHERHADANWFLGIRTINYRSNVSLSARPRDWNRLGMQ
jgi:hypothetical protein